MLHVLICICLLIRRPAPALPPPHSPVQEAHQLCDLGLVLLRQIAGRLTRGKPLEPGRFPGQVVLPRLCFRPNMEQSERRLLAGWPGLIGLLLGRSGEPYLPPQHTCWCTTAPSFLTVAGLPDSCLCSCQPFRILLLPLLQARRLMAVTCRPPATSPRASTKTSSS